MLPRRACPPGRAERYLLCPAVSAYCPIRPPWRLSGLPWGLFSSNGKGNVTAREHPGARWLHFQARPGGQPAALRPCHPMQGMIRRRFAAFSPWPGRRKGRRRSPCRKAGWITQPAALPQSRKPMLPLPAAPDTTEKNGPAPLYGGAGRAKAGRNLAARGTAFRPHRGFCPQSLWPSEKVALLCTQHSV